MNDAENLRRQKATSTDPAWLEREARMAEAKENVSRLDWLEMCRVAIEIRRRSGTMGHRGVRITDKEMTVLVCAAIEYSNRLAHEAGDRQRALLPKTRLAWIVTETAYGKTWGWRHFLDLDEALRTAGVWVKQSFGDVTISRREVEV